MSNSGSILKVQTTEFLMNWATGHERKDCSEFLSMSNWKEGITLN